MEGFLFITIKKNPTELKTRHAPHNYTISLTIEKRTLQYHLNKLIYETFKGSIQDDEIIKHLDGDRTNCHIDNLYLVKKR